VADGWMVFSWFQIRNMGFETTMRRRPARHPGIDRWQYAGINAGLWASCSRGVRTVVSHTEHTGDMIARSGDTNVAVTGCMTVYCEARSSTDMPSLPSRLALR
jgi:hypothetical protein